MGGGGGGNSYSKNVAVGKVCRGKVKQYGGLWSELKRENAPVSGTDCRTRLAGILACR